MTLCHLCNNRLAYGAYAALLAWSVAAAGCGNVKLPDREDASTPGPGPGPGPGPADAAPGSADATPGASDARSEIDGGGTVPGPDAGLSCIEEDIGSSIGNPVYFGSTQGEPDRADYCADDEGGGRGYGDLFLLWTAPATGKYQFDTCGSNFDTILTALADACDGSLLLCNDDSGVCNRDDNSSFQLDVVEGQRIILIVDGYQDEGDFRLNIAPR